MKNDMNWRCDVCKCEPKEIIVIGSLRPRYLCKKCFKEGK